MTTNYLLPAAAALIAHSALLFGLVSTPRLVPPDEGGAVTPDRARTPLVILDDPPAERADEGERERTRAELSFARLAEPRMPIPVVERGGLPIVRVEHAGFRDVPLRAAGEGPLGLAPAGPPVFRTGELDRTPRIRTSSAPGYPFEARKAGLTGEVLVEFLVNERGEVESPRAVNATHPVFVDSALKAATRWRFEPGRKDGRPVRFRMAVPFVFTLDR